MPTPRNPWPPRAPERIALDVESLGAYCESISFTAGAAREIAYGLKRSADADHLAGLCEALNTMAREAQRQANRLGAEIRGLAAGADEED